MKISNRKQLAYIKSEIEKKYVFSFHTAMRMADCSEDDVKGLDDKKINRVVFAELDTNSDYGYVQALHALFNEVGVSHSVYVGYLKDSTLCIPNIPYIVVDGSDKEWYYYHGYLSDCDITGGTKII